MENNELLLEELIKLIHESDVETLKHALQHYHNNDIAKVQPDLSEEDQEKLMKALDEEDLSDVVSYVEDFDEFIENMDTETVADIIEGMDVDDAIDALEELVEDIKLIQSYEDDEIGSKMTTNFIVVDRGLFVKDVMKTVFKEAEEHDNIMTIYVKDEENKNLDILMDVKLQLNVELGRCELPIKKVLELTRGSIIELDKVAGESVELFANGKHVANGEVVFRG